jgi:hypothetical protein
MQKHRWLFTVMTESQAIRKLPALRTDQYRKMLLGSVIR